jgi:hypothetical protein
MDVRTYVTLEQTLARRLRKSWAKLSAGALKNLNVALTAGDFDLARTIAASLSLKDVGVQNEQYILYLLRSCVVFGAGSVNGVPGVLLDKDTQRFLDTATSTMLLYFEHGGTADLQRQAAQLIARVEATVQKAERKVKDFVSFKDVGDDQVQLISSLHSSRMAVWGFTAEAELEGVTRYRLDAVLDGRTSDFCRLIHGKEFAVSDARKTIMEALGAQDPNELKTIQPWPSQSKASLEAIQGMSEQQLVDARWHIPPFHPGCRTLCSMVGQVSRLKKPAPVMPSELDSKLSTEDSFKQVGVHLTPQQVDHWNAYVGVGPAQWLAKLAGVDPLQALEGVFGKNSIKIVANGDILTTVKGVFGSTKFSIGTILDPFSGKVYLSQADFLAGDVGSEAVFLKSLLKNVLDSGKAVSAKSVAVSVGAYAYAYSKLGFVPTPGKWQEIRLHLMEELTEGKLQKVLQGLSEDKQTLLLNLLSNQSEHALSVLVDLPWTYRGKAVGEVLLADIEGVFEIDLGSTKAVEKAMDYLT